MSTSSPSAPERTRAARRALGNVDAGPERIEPASEEPIESAAIGSVDQAIMGTVGPASGGPLDLGALFGGSTADLKALAADPQELLRRWLEQRNAAAQAQTSGVAEVDEDDLELQRLDHLRAEQERASRLARLRELRDLIRDLYAEVEQLRIRNDRIAAALGACHLCFGMDLGCEECGGRGQPGSLRPDHAMFRAMVIPAIRRLRETVVSTNPNAPAIGGVEEAPRPTLYD